MRQKNMDLKILQASKEEIKKLILLKMQPEEKRAFLKEKVDQELKELKQKEKQLRKGIGLIINFNCVSIDIFKFKLFLYV